MFQKINSLLSGRKTEIGIIAYGILEVLGALGIAVHPGLWPIVLTFTGVGVVRRATKLAGK